MQRRRLGATDLDVPAIGLGCMGMSDFYGPRDESECLATLDHALGIGVDFWDTADVYGPHTNERLLGKALEGRRDKVILATKFGIVREPGEPISGIDGRPAYVRKACDASLERLGTDYIDLYYQHRIDPQTPVEDTVGAMADLVRAGKVRYIGLSEASAATLRRAHAVHPVTALQSEYSLWSRDIEGDILETCRELRIGLVAYSPLGRGFLGGNIRSIDDLAADDARRSHPRFQGENFAKNLQLVHRVDEIAAAKRCTPAQLAIAWVLAQGSDIVPIPGTRKTSRLEENIAALDIALSDGDLAHIEAALPAGVVTGTRYPEPMLRYING